VLFDGRVLSLAADFIICSSSVVMDRAEERFFMQLASPARPVMPIVRSVREQAADPSKPGGLEIPI
jgi:hypothetical protein